MLTTAPVAVLRPTLTRTPQVEVGSARYSECLRGRVFAPIGLLKVVFETGSGVIVGVHIVGADACELVHYGMSLVLHKATLASVLSTLFTAVTYHELFNIAAEDGNRKLRFGAQFSKVFEKISGALGGPAAINQAVESGELKRVFDQIDTDRSGELGPSEVAAVLEEATGAAVTPGLVAGLIRLADRDGNGNIDWPEFEAAIKEIAQAGPAV